MNNKTPRKYMVIYETLWLWAEASLFEPPPKLPCPLYPPPTDEEWLEALAEEADPVNPFPLKVCVCELAVESEFPPPEAPAFAPAVAPPTPPWNPLFPKVGVIKPPLPPPPRLPWLKPLCPPTFWVWAVASALAWLDSPP